MKGLYGEGLKKEETVASGDGGKGGKEQNDTAMVRGRSELGKKMKTFKNFNLTN